MRLHMIVFLIIIPLIPGDPTYKEALQHLAENNLTVDCTSEDLTQSQLLIYRSLINENNAWLQLGENCSVDEKVLNYQAALEIPQAKPDSGEIMERPQLDKICSALHDIWEDPTLLICNSTALLYCKPFNETSSFGFCNCIENFEEDNFGIVGIKPESCVLKQGAKCGASWRTSDLNELQGFPQSSPHCDTDRCVEDAESGEAVCTDDEVGLTLLMVLKHKVEELPSASRSFLLIPQLRPVFGWICLPIYFYTYASFYLR